MTNTNELTAKLKDAAQKATQGPWVETCGEVTTADYEIEGVTFLDHICNCEIIGTESPNAEFIAAANPANVLALVEALEAAEKRIASLEESHAQVIEARDHWKRCATEGLSKLANARTLTVKLPHWSGYTCSGEGAMLDACVRSLESQGFTVQIEGE